MAARKKHLMEVTLGSRGQEIKPLLRERRLALETTVFNWLISWYSRPVFWARMENKLTTYVGYSIQSPTSWRKTPNRQRHLHKQLTSLFRKFRSTVGKKLPIKTASGSVEMKLSNGKRHHTMKRDLDPSSSGSHSCSEHKGCSLQYTCLIEFIKQSNLNSARGPWMPRKGDGGLKNPTASPEDVNDVKFVSNQNFLSCSPENSKVAKKNARRYDCYRESRKQIIPGAPFLWSHSYVTL